MAEITYEVLKEALAYRNVPILTLNQRWYQLVPEISKTDEIRYWEGQVNELLKRQGQVTNDLTDVKKIKSQLIQDVVENMEEDSSSKHKKRMNKNQRLIHEAKEKILQLPNTLSGGQQQRVTIARALLTKPSLILADEPTGNLDSKNSHDVIDMLTSASKRFQQTILMITHNNNLTALVDRVFHVSDGVLTDLGGRANETLS